MATSSGSSQTSLDDSEVVEQGSFVDINVTPLVDIMLVLLVILMATSTAILEAGAGQGSGFKVTLPTGAKSEEVTTGGNELVIAILKNGEIVARGQSVSLAELTGVLKDEAAKGKERLVLVQADEESLHRRVVQVMEAARSVGLVNLAIATKPEGE
jgi:biopolymer transport protein TolR